MIDQTIMDQLVAQSAPMPVDQERQVLEFARSLASHSSKGFPGAALLKYAGTIPESDLELMSRAIEEDCGIGRVPES